MTAGAEGMWREADADGMLHRDTTDLDVGTLCKPQISMKPRRKH